MDNQAMNETEIPVPTSKDIYPAEHVRKALGIKNLVEKRVLAAPTPSGIPDLTAEFQNLSTREKTDLLYEKLMAYSVATRMMREERKQDAGTEVEPIDPYLVAEIRALWQDPPTQSLFTDRAAEARIDARLYRASETGRNWKEINRRIADTREVFEEETRRLFLQQSTRPDQVSAAQGRTARFARELIRLQQEKQGIIALKDVPSTFENTDAAANIMYETLAKYSGELNQGFVWLPSRLNIHVATVEALQNGRWPVLRGEAGTGKSEQADAAAVVLTGEQPTHLACGQNTTARDLIADKEIDPATGGSYEEYGPPMQAATGYEDSREREPRFKTGRIVRFDESGKLGDKGYTEVKELRQKRPATPEDIKRFKEGNTIDPDNILNGKPVLPGFAAIFTTNPEGSRYPNRTEPDAALRRELSYISVDYPDMSDINPELYEFMLAALMDENHHITAAKSELTPDYSLVPRDYTLPDGRRVKAQQTLTLETTNSKHGILYRLAHAIRRLQDAFILGNQGEPAKEPLYFKPKDDGTIEILNTSAGGEVLTLNNSTITLGEIASWMKGFNERRLKDDPNYQVSTLTQWLQLKLKTYLNQVDEVDRDKIQAIFKYYNLFDAAPDLAHASPITPKEIGYLSPRVPRALHLDPSTGTGETLPPPAAIVPIPDLYTDFSGFLEDGSNILVKPGVLDFEREGRAISLRNGSLVTLGGEKFRFAGFSPDGKPIVRLANEDLYRVVDLEQLKLEGEFNFIMQEAEDLFGADFIGPDQIEKAFGIKIADAPDILFTMEELKEANDRDEVLIIFTDKAPDGQPLTIEKMLTFLQPRFDSERKGGTLRNIDWCKDTEDFYKKDITALRWRLVSKGGIPDSANKNYLQQTEGLANYVKDTVFKGQPIPSEFQEALREFERQKSEIDTLLGNNRTWNQAGEKLEKLKLNEITRLSPIEDAYFSLAYFQNTGERLLQDAVNWTNKRTSLGYVVALGSFDSRGVRVVSWDPVRQFPNLVVRFAR